MKRMLGAALAASLFGTSPSPVYLTPDGYGSARLGMPVQQITEMLGTLEDGRGDFNCLVARSGKDRGVRLLFIRDRLARVEVRAPSRARTPRGIGIGSTEAEVRRAYGPGLQVEANEYEPAPAKNLTFWTHPDARGVRFETDASQRVVAIYAGDRTIRYAEGCS
ncbi:hypothetical protein [Sphingomonas sp.]|uniref:hypothetical protein n=1 Tax=Sphingomonas sp. TaxID=28214 RepID=UPI001B2F77CA|nr:hypothetical protein [Sphingomonas sp.]MBO9714252.1 hypothetical protein [Sphingomonas sp.]